MAFLSQRVFGYSKLEWISFAVVAACLLSLLIPSCQNWRKQSKADEASQNLRIIFDAQQAYFARKLADNPATASYLQLPTTPTTTSNFQQTAAFDQSPWSELKLKLDNEVWFSYEVVATGFGPNAYFDAYASGDLDGDGKQSIYKIRGSLDPNGKPLGKDIIYKIDPLE